MREQNQRIADDNYHRDPRVLAMGRTELYRVRWYRSGRACLVLNEDYITRENFPEMHDVDENEHEVEAEKQRCEMCRGDGTVVNPSIDSHGITGSEFDEDPEFREDYFSGRFDIECPECGGKGLIVVPVLPEAIAKLIDEHNRDEAEYRAIERAERLAGC